jgi:conjugal transfer pilus assembly protein TrbC
MSASWVRVGIGVLLGVGGISALLGQTVEGIDIQAIKRRAVGLEGDAAAIVDHVKDRGDAFREDALAVQDGGTENMRRIAASDLPTGPNGAIDFDAIIEGAAANLNGKAGEAPQFIAFASLSMPPASLKQMVHDTAKAGGIVVFRGVSQPNSPRSSMLTISPISALIPGCSGPSMCKPCRPMSQCHRILTLARASTAPRRSHPMTG